MKKSRFNVIEGWIGAIIVLLIILYSLYTNFIVMDLPCLASAYRNNICLKSVEVINYFLYFIAILLGFLLGVVINYLRRKIKNK